MTAGWHDLPKAHQSFTDIFFLHTLLEAKHGAADENTTDADLENTASVSVETISGDYKKKVLFGIL